MLEHVYLSKMFSCPLCTKAFKKPSLINNHIASHTKEKPHKCRKCSAAFGFAGHLKTHIETVHEGVKRITKTNFQCPSCSYKCPRKTQMKYQLQTHSAEQPFSCNIPNCGFKTKCERSLSKHTRVVHSEERPYKCRSAGCNYRGKTKVHLKSHLKIHSNEKPFGCNVQGCNYSGKTKMDLKCHTFRVHSDEKPFNCSTCCFRATTRSNLTNHQLTHTRLKQFQCQAPNCGFASHVKDYVRRHFDTIHRKKDVRCTEPGCNYRCGSTSILHVHLRKHENQMLKCPGDSCNFSTRFKGCLLRHMSRHYRDVESARIAGERIIRGRVVGTTAAMETIHCCFPNCGYETKFPHHYDRHTITHKKEEKFQHVCSLCFSIFSDSAKLRAHIQRHTGEKPYSCSHCKYRTVRGADLRAHATKSHQIYVFSCGKVDQIRKCRTCSKNFWSHSEFVLHSMIHLQPIVVLERLRVNVM